MYLFKAIEEEEFASVDTLDELNDLVRCYNLQAQLALLTGDLHQAASFYERAMRWFSNEGRRLQEKQAKAGTGSADPHQQALLGMPFWLHCRVELARVRTEQGLYAQAIDQCKQGLEECTNMGEVLFGAELRLLTVRHLRPYQLLLPMGTRTHPLFSELRMRSLPSRHFRPNSKCVWAIRRRASRLCRSFCLLAPITSSQLARLPTPTWCRGTFTWSFLRRARLTWRHRNVMKRPHSVPSCRQRRC